jgi:hypothetical protein
MQNVFLGFAAEPCSLCHIDDSGMLCGRPRKPQTFHGHDLAPQPLQAPFFFTEMFEEPLCILGAQCLPDDIARHLLRALGIEFLA